MVNKAAHISGSLIDHVYLKRALMEDFFTNNFFSDHDSVLIVTVKVRKLK